MRSCGAPSNRVLVAMTKLLLIIDHLYRFYSSHTSHFAQIVLKGDRFYERIALPHSKTMSWNLRHCCFNMSPPTIELVWIGKFHEYIVRLSSIFFMGKSSVQLVHLDIMLSWGIQMCTNVSQSTEFICVCVVRIPMQTPSITHWYTTIHSAHLVSHTGTQLYTVHTWYHTLIHSYTQYTLGITH